MKFITFITTIYNTEINFLDDLFESFEEVKYDDRIEFLIIDDASVKGGGFEYLENKYKNEPNFKFIKMDKNTRRTGAFLEGIKKSTGKYLMSLDSDDLVHSNSLLKFLDVIESTDADFIYNNFIYRDFSGHTWENTNYSGPSLNKIIPNGSYFERWSTFTAYNTLVKGDFARGLNYDITNISAPHDDAYFTQVWISNTDKTLFLEEPFFIYNINQPWTTFSGHKSIAKSKEKMKSHWNLSKEIIKMYDPSKPLTIINITSILSSHQKAMVLGKKIKIPFFWLKLKFVLPRSLRKHSLYKNSHFRRHRLSGFALF